MFMNYGLTYEQRMEQFMWIMIILIIFLGIYGILFYIKKIFRDKIENSKSKLIKKIFKDI